MSHYLRGIGKDIALDCQRAQGLSACYIFGFAQNPALKNDTWVRILKEAKRQFEPK